MARKPKDSGRLEAKKKRRLKRLQRKSEGGFSGGESFSVGPLGMEKMSVALNEFVEPFLPATSHVDELQTLFSFGVLAWNTALLPEQEPEAAIDDIVRKMGPSTRADPEEVRVVLKQLILRKKTHFANNRRLIAGFDLRGTEDGYHLNVVSSLDLPEGP